MPASITPFSDALAQRQWMEDIIAEKSPTFPVIRRGGVNSDGTVRFGLEFTSLREAVGLYKIVFTPALTKPVFSVTFDQIDATPDTPSPRWFSHHTVDSSTVRVGCYDSASALQDTVFSFIAIV